MASANKKSGNSTANRAAGTRRRTTSGASGSRPHSRKTVKKTPLLTVLKDSPPGRFLLLFIAVVSVLGLDFLFSLNKFDRFFLLLGIELIAAVLIGWIRFVLRGRIDDND